MIANCRKSLFPYKFYAPLISGMLASAIKLSFIESCVRIQNCYEVFSNSLFLIRESHKPKIFDLKWDICEHSAQKAKSHQYNLGSR